MWVLWLFKKDYPWKQVTIAGIIRCCPASVPYSLPLPPQVRQQGKKLGFFSPLQQHKVQSIYRNIGAEVISARTQQIYLYIQVHKTREVTTSSSWATRSFLFSPLLFFFFFFSTAQHGNFFWIICSELEHQISNFCWKHGYLKKMGMNLCLLTACEETITEIHNSGEPLGKKGRKLE